MSKEIDNPAIREIVRRSKWFDEVRACFGQMRIGDLREDDRVRLTCVSCGQGLDLSGSRVRDLAYGYRPLQLFAASHGCGWCGKIGAQVDVRAAGDD